MRRRGRCVLAASLAALAGCAATGPSPQELAVDVQPAVEEYMVAADPEGQVRAVLVHHSGEPVVERYVDTTAEAYWNTWSVTKSVMSTLVGIAIADGHIEGVEQTLGELLPSRAAEMSDDTAAVTLHEVLTHTGGLAAMDLTENDYSYAEDWVGHILAHRNETGPGDGSFAYSNAGPHLLSAVLVEATGVSVLDYAREELFDPLGIRTDGAFEPAFDFGDEAAAMALDEEYTDAGVAWPVDPQGLHDGACCLKLRPEDLAAIGQLYLDEGQWGEEQVVPAGWVEQATTAHVEVTDAGTVGYGYLWWITDVAGEPGFMAFGSGGQAIQVVPGHDLVVVVATEYDVRDPARRSKEFGPEAATGLVELAVAPHLDP